jgi:hypothetical protein
MPYHGPVVWRFKVDLEGPVASVHTPPPGSIIGDTQPIISVNLTDDYAGVYDESIIIAIDNKEIREISPPPTIMLDVNSQGVYWDGRRFSFDPSEIGLNFLEPDSVCIRIIRAVDLIRELDETGYFDYGDPNDLQETTLDEWCFVIPDDDTLCPKFSEFEPIYPERLMPYVPFDVTVLIEDPSGIYDDETGSDGQGVYLLWDNDGSIDDGTFNEILMSHSSGDTYKTDVSVPGQSENALYSAYKEHAVEKKRQQDIQRRTDKSTRRKEKLKRFYRSIKKIINWRIKISCQTRSEK